jgi:hypothetical protein
MPWLHVIRLWARAPANRSRARCLICNRYGEGDNVPHDNDTPEDRRPKPVADDDRAESDDDMSEAERRALVNDPESPGATIDTDHPAEPNEPA